MSIASLRTAALAAVFLAVAAAPNASASGANGTKNAKSTNGTKNPKAAAKNNKPQTRDLSKGNTLYVVPYAHLDTQWRWAYPQVIREYIANTLFDNFALIEKYPNYVFNFSGSRRYEMMEEYYPEAFAKMKEYVKAGRWFPCGSSVDEGDANVPSGESLVRHVLYGNRYFQRELGVYSHEFMLPDCFGFPYALPSILTYCGVKGFSTQKLTWGSPVGIPFKVGNWEGPDGKTIVAALDPGSYAADITEDLSVNTSWLARIQNTGKQSGAYVDYHYYGTGDKGGAPHASAAEWVEKSINGKGPITVVSSRADEMFLSLTKGQIDKLPRYKGELLLTEHSAGSITSQAYMKRWNRKSELLADAAERASVTAMWLGGAAYPSDRLYSAWDLVLGSQMHDMLPGTSIPKAYEFCWNDFLLAQNKFAAVAQDAVGAVTSVMDTRAQGRSIVVYNPLSIEREDVVEVVLPGAQARHGLQAFGPDGKPVPTQSIGFDEKGEHLLILAKVPANGFAAFDVRQVRPTFTSKSSSAANVLENTRFKVTINKGGDISSIYDKANRREALKSPVRLAFQHHNPSAWPAWNMDWADANKPPIGYVTGAAQVRVVESGPVRTTVEITRESQGSKFVQLVRLANGGAGNRIEVVNKIDWQTKEVALKASFPLATANPEATYELQLGTIKRGNNNPKKYEVPQHQWFDLTKPDGSYGVAILNDSKYGSDKPNDSTIQLTMIYTPGTRGGYADQGTQDIGKHEITFGIAPHAGDWRKGDVSWEARRLNQPLRAFNVPSHAGKLGKAFSLMQCSNRQVEIMAIKKAEDNGDIIVRLRELTGNGAKGVRITGASPIVSAQEVDGQERPLGKASVNNGTLTTDISGYAYKSFAIKLGNSPTKAVATTSKPVALAYDVDAASTDANRKDGAFDKAGRTYAAEQLPSTLTVGGIGFKLGSTKNGAKNAVAANGQKIALPAGYSKVYLLASSSEGDVKAAFRVGDKQSSATVQAWDGFIGLWDNRLWVGDVGPDYTNYGEMGGLVPGYVKNSEVAWYASHSHHPSKGNEHYEYTYLYKYSFDIPKGATSITLPKDSRVKVFAVSVAKNGHDSVKASKPLYDMLEDHLKGSAPKIVPANGTFSDETSVRVEHPLYWRKGGLRYTLDGSVPTLSSPAYNGAIMLNNPTKLTVAEVGPDGKAAVVVSGKFDIRDTTAPKIAAASSPKILGMARVVFSERVTKASAEDASNYSFSSDTIVVSAKLSADQKTVELTLNNPLPTGQTETISVSGVQDLSSAGNRTSGARATVVERGAVFTSPALEPNTTKVFPVENLPVKAKDAWTLNFFCKTDKQPEDRTLIAGFGRAADGRTGTGRYFTKFARGLNFWAANKDTMTSVPLDLGKWQMLTATYDGATMRLYKNGELIAENKVELSDDQPQVRVMPLDAWERQRRFNGEVRDLTVWDQDLTPAAIKRLWEAGKGK